MRRITVISTAALILAPVIALAQTPPAAATAPAQTPAPVTITSAFADFGGRGTTSTGEASRYERYRDLRDGLFLNTFRVEHERANWLFSATGHQVGRLDQRLGGSVVKPGTVTFWEQWDQIPMLLSRATRTLYIENFGRATPSGVLTIPDALQAQMQTASTAARPGIFATNALGFESASRRHIGSGGVEYLANRDLTLRATVSSASRQGTLPYGGSFGHSSQVEMPAPIRHRLTDVDTNAEYAHENLLLRGGFTGSWFHNDITQVTFDNPFQATDLAGTPSRGQLSLPPSNSFLGANGTVSVRLPRRSRVTGYVSTGWLQDAGAPLMAQTINSVNLPAITPLPRTTVDGHARTTGVNLTFTSRPVRLLDFSAHYRLYHYDNLTPEFVLPQRVSYDNAPAAATFSTLGGATSPLTVETEPFGIRRQTFDADVRMKPGRFGAAGVGYTRQMEDRTHRAIDSTTENILRVTYDAVGMSMFSLRTKYEHGQRRGVMTDEAKLELFNIGEQPELRQFDIASRNRNRVTLVGSVMPASTVFVNGSVALGRDDYLQSMFGLRDNRHRIFAGGVDLVPTERVSYGASYSYERYDALMHSRQVASPPSGANVLTFDQFVLMSSLPNPTQAIADPRYDWADTGADRVHSAIAYLAITQIRSKLDLRFSYDYNRARALYTYATGANIPLRTLPEDVDPTLTALPPPTQLPLIRSKTQRGTFDATYSLTRRIGLGFSYWYEDYSADDFTLDDEANASLIRGSSLLLGYLYRPYTAQTAWGRLIVRW